MRRILFLDEKGFLHTGVRRLPCLVGRAGVDEKKQEGDGITPTGIFRLRELLYRPDRRVLSTRGLKSSAIGAHIGWCDDARFCNAPYNRPFRLPARWRHEKLKRADGLYDLVIPFSYNDCPPERGRGSALFIHCGAPGQKPEKPTEGCLALEKAHLRALLPFLSADTLLFTTRLRPWHRYKRRRPFTCGRSHFVIFPKG